MRCVGKHNQSQSRETSTVRRMIDGERKKNTSEDGKKHRLPKWVCRYTYTTRSNKTLGSSEASLSVPILVFAFCLYLFNFYSLFRILFLIVIIISVVSFVAVFTHRFQYWNCLYCHIILHTYWRLSKRAKSKRIRSINTVCVCRLLHLRPYAVCILKSAQRIMQIRKKLKFSTVYYRPNFFFFHSSETWTVRIGMKKESEVRNRVVGIAWGESKRDKDNRDLLMQHSFKFTETVRSNWMLFVRM